MLTATDVEQKTFSTALRGYDLDEVDDFLDEVVATIRDLNEQLEAAKGAQPAPAVAPVPEPAVEPAPEPERPEPVVEAQPSIDESAIGRALVAAQTAADQLLQEARAQADQIVEGARGEADTLEAEKEARKAAAESEIAALAARVASIRSELSVLAGEVSEKLDEMDAVIEEGKPEDVAGNGGVGMHEAMAAGGESAASESDVDDAGTGEEGEMAQDEETETGTTNGTDHLDEILTGVATDLQLETDQPSDEGSEDADGAEESDDSDDSDDSGQSMDDDYSSDDEESGL